MNSLWSPRRWGGGRQDKRNINLAQIPKYWKSILPDGPTIEGGDVWNTLLTKSCSTDFAEFILQCTQSNQFKKVVLSYQQTSTWKWQEEGRPKVLVPFYWNGHFQQLYTMGLTPWAHFSCKLNTCGSWHCTPLDVLTSNDFTGAIWRFL
jgi:hypothetical protein